MNVEIFEETLSAQLRGDPLSPPDKSKAAGRNVIGPRSKSLTIRSKEGGRGARPIITAKNYHWEKERKSAASVAKATNGWGCSIN